MPVWLHAHAFSLQNLQCWRSCDGACMLTHTPTVSQWAVKLKTSHSFSKPHCFAYKTLTCIMLAKALIMVLKSKMHFRGRGVMEMSAAGKRGDQQEAGGGK